MKSSNSKDIEKRKFAKGICFDKLVIIFTIGAMVGTFYEEILTSIKLLKKTGNIIWESRRGVIYGPFNPLYGFALALITYIFCKDKVKENKGKTFIEACLLGGAIEYFVSFLQELVVGTVSWNYSNKFLNINGRTTIPFMIFWGLCSYIYIYKIYPRLSKAIENIPRKLGKYIVIFFTVFLSLDMLISFGALVRQDFRKRNIEPLTKVGEFFDTHYDDEFLFKYYPNMVRKRGRQK